MNTKDVEREHLHYMFVITSFRGNASHTCMQHHCMVVCVCALACVCMIVFVWLSDNVRMMSYENCMTPRACNRVQSNMALYV